MPNTKEKYLSDYKKQKEKYLNNKEVMTSKAQEAKTLAKFTAEPMMNLYSKKIFASLKVNDLYNLFDKICTKNDHFKKFFDDLMSSRINSGKYKDELTGKNINEIGEYFINNKDDEFNNSLSEIVSNYFSSSDLTEPFKVFDIILENTEMKEELLPEESKYITFMEDPESRYEYVNEEERVDLLKTVKKQKEVDEELVRYLEEAKYTLASTESERGTLSKYGEAVGTSTNEVFMTGFNKFIKDTDYALYEENFDFDSIDEIIEFNKKNVIDKKSSDKHKEMMIKSVKALRENEIKEERVNFVFDKYAKEAEKAIQKGLPKNFKEKYKMFDDKIKVIDSIIDDLKSVDPEHLYTSNLTSFRAPTRPPKYLLDVEGNTLINSALEVNKACNNLNVEPEKLINDPIKTTREIYKNFEEKCSNGFDKVFKGEGKNIFDIFINRDQYETGFDEITKIEDADNKLDFLFPQVISALTINNPENRYEYFLSVQNGILTAGKAHRLNEKEILEATKDNSRMVDEIMPTVILAGDDFNPFKMINTENGLMDISKQERRPDFDLSVYLEKIPTEEIDRRMEDALKDFNKTNLEISEKVMKSASEKVKEAIMNRSKVDERELDRLMKHYSGEITLSSADKKTILSEIAFGEITKNGIVDKNVRLSFEMVADLNKNYKSNNFLKRIFSPSLRRQNKAINSMKVKLSELTGLSKKGVDDYIKISESKSVDKDERLEAFINAIGVEKENKEYTYETIKEELRASLVKSDFYLNKEDLEFKLSLVDKEMQKLSEKPLDEFEVKDLKTLTIKKFDVADKFIKHNPGLAKEDYLIINDQINNNLKKADIKETIEKFDKIIDEANKNIDTIDKNVDLLSSIKEPIDLTDVVNKDNNAKEIKANEKVKEVELEKEIEMNVGAKNE